ncbi:hypothetical protein ACFFQW_03675 [Umezawaea endophytica]|uniref:Uncharacterized protein n=1 Tax=Umezawaea endophytica TaxID=1654476 RepID=A0A9X3A2N3_9PSEU|nr:hypothetical protein [Umezawaea endophytica]MCS7479248.1 hypothetical protein [Umezawaea endophytica]
MPIGTTSTLTAVGRHAGVFAGSAPVVAESSPVLTDRTRKIVLYRRGA